MGPLLGDCFEILEQAFHGNALVNKDDLQGLSRSFNTEMSNECAVGHVLL